MLSEYQTDSEEQALQLRNEFDTYVTQDFCITAQDAQDYLVQARGNTTSITEAFKAVGEFLRKEERVGRKWQEEEICSSLIPAEIERLVSKPLPIAAPKASNKTIPYSTMQQLSLEFAKRIPGYSINEAEVQQLMELSRGRINIILHAMRLTGNFVKTRKFLVLDHDTLITKLIGKIMHETKACDAQANKNSTK